MTRKIRTILLIAFLFLGMLSHLHAQDRYDYAVISFKPASLELMVSQNGTDFKKIEVTEDEVKNKYFDTNAALKEVNKMGADGWELFNTNSFFAGTGPAYVYFLRRKIK